MAVLTSSRGLVTQPNELTRADGALSVADNVVIDYDNTIQQRRGLAQYETLASSPKQLMTYKNQLLVNYASSVAYDNGSGTFTAFMGSFEELVPGLRMKFLETNANFYFTTSQGIKKISVLSAADFPTAVVTDAGGVKAIDLSATLVSDAAGYLPAQSKAAYRLVFGTKDVNENLILGSPSSRVVLTNTAQNVNQSEVFTVNILDYTGISASQYFVFNTPNSGYFVWYDLTGTDPAPATADTLNRTGVKVDINGLTSDTDVAAATANAMAATISEITVSVVTDEVTVTIVEPGNVSDAGQGDLSSGDVLITKVFDGSISTGIPANGSLNFTIPNGIITDYFYQIYRTGVVTVSTGLTLNDIDPGDEMNLVIETPITLAQISTGQITVIDNTPENFRAAGAPLYTNAISGQGILQANERPPIAQDIALFRNSTFYANTKEVHRLNFSMLSVDDYVSGMTKLTIGQGPSALEYTFVGVNQVETFDVLPKSESVGGSYITQNSAQNLRSYYFWLDKGTISHDFNSTTDVDATTDTITITNHGFATNDPILFTGTVPGGLIVDTIYYAIRTNANDFQVKATVGGSAIDLTDAVGTANVVHVSLNPNLPNSIGIKIPLVLYDDTAVGTMAAFLDAIASFADFSGEISGGAQVSLTMTDSGPVDTPTQSTPPTGWTVTVTTPGEGEDDLLRQVLLSTSPSVGIAIEQTARSLVQVINRDTDSPVFAIYLSGSDDLPGKILLEAKTLEDLPFYISINDAALSGEFTPELPVTITLDSINSTTNVFTTLTAHGFAVGNEVYLQDNPGAIPTEFGGKFTILTVPSITTFTLVGVDVGINQPGPLSGVVYLTLATSTNNPNSNRVYFSKASQPEAVPLVNYVDVGSKNKPIQRILALRDSLFVLKDDGVYLITGQGAAFGVTNPFSNRLLDNSAIILAPDSAVVLNNQIFMLSNQGVVTVTETGVTVASRQIENLIQKITTSQYDYKHTSFGVSYENDRSYILWMPTTKNDNIATQAFRFNTFTSTWTRWVLTERCGIVNFLGTGLLYTGSGDRNAIDAERKNGDRTDYADLALTRSLAANAWVGNTVTISSVSNIEYGDVMVQLQYLNIPKFNRLLNMLDSDPNTSIKTYYSDLHVSLGANLATSLQNLVTLLNTDANLSGIFTPPSGVNTYTAIKTDFNTLIDELNDPTSGTAFKNYMPVDELLTYEALILSIGKTTNTLEMNFSTWFTQGEVTVYKSIHTEAQYAPQHFGKPEMFKQIHEGTVIFDQNNIYGASISYSSDRSPSFVEVLFRLKTPGFWACYAWGETAPWGGLGTESPLRTLIPQQKARCRYLNVKFKHRNARESYKLLGISLEPREFSSKAYR